eukprot:3546357-Prorocentrum_lima.AAC.1
MCIRDSLHPPLPVPLRLGQRMHNLGLKALLHGHTPVATLPSEWNITCECCGAAYVCLPSASCSRISL